MSVKSILKKNRWTRGLCEKPYHFVQYLKAQKHHQSFTISDGYSIQRLSPFGQNFFFGYYDKTPWNQSQDLVLAIKTPFSKAMPHKDTFADVALLKPGSNSAPVFLATSNAWCWQQGNMLQWIPYRSEEGILFNGHERGSYCTTILDKEGKKLDEWPLPTFAISKSGLHAVGLDFGRLDHCAPGYGYVAEKFLQQTVFCPKNSGLFLWDVVARQKKLLLSLAEIVEYKPFPEFGSSYHYFAHAGFNPSGKRLVFFHRWQRKGSSEKTRFFTIDIEKGSESLHLLADHGMTSHYTWKNDETLIAWATHQAGTHYYEFKDQSSEPPKILGGDVLLEDGHPSISPCGRWMVTDTYPDEHYDRHLYIYDLMNGPLHHIGRFHVPWRYYGPLRCDLHPRWSPCGNYICVDSVHEGFRGMYAINVSTLMSR